MSTLDNVNFFRDARNCKPDAAPVIEIEQADGSSFLEVTLPTTWVVCPVCDGEGKHVNPAIDCNGLTPEDFAEDPDFAEGYMRGDYDQTCNRCQGRTTVREVDTDKLTPELRAAWEQWQRDEAATRAEQLAEIRMGA